MCENVALTLHSWRAIARRGNSRDQAPAGISVRLSEMLKKAAKVLNNKMGPRCSRRVEIDLEVWTGEGAEVEGLGKSRRRRRREEAVLGGGAFLGSGLRHGSGGREEGIEMSSRMI